MVQNCSWNFEMERFGVNNQYPYVKICKTSVKDFTVCIYEPQSLVISFAAKTSRTVYMSSRHAMKFKPGKPEKNWEMAHFRALTFCSPISTSIGITRHYFSKPITRTVPNKFNKSKHAVWKHGLGLKFESKHTAWKHGFELQFDARSEPTNTLNCICKAQIDSGEAEVSEAELRNQKVLQVALWVMEGVYICWLFLLPYAPVHSVYSLPSVQSVY